MHSVKLSDEVMYILQKIREKFNVSYNDAFIIALGTNPDLRIEDFLGDDYIDYIKIKARAVKERPILFCRRNIAIKHRDKFNILKELKMLYSTRSSKKDIMNYLNCCISLNVDDNDNDFRQFLMRFKSDIEKKSSKMAYNAILPFISEYFNDMKVIGETKDERH